MALPFARPLSLAPDFALSSIGQDDIDGVISCHHQAFNSPGERFWWSPDLDAMRAFQRASLEKNLKSGEKRYFKITHTPSGELAAFASWVLPKRFDGLGLRPVVGTDTNNEGARAVAAVEEIGLYVDSSAHSTLQSNKVSGEADMEEYIRQIVSRLPDGASKEGLAEAVRFELHIHNRYGAEEMLNLAVLCTSPRYERRGLAKALIEPVLEIAQANGMPVWVYSSPVGKGFYEKLGFVVIEAYDLDLSNANRGLEGVHRVTAMQWNPKPSIRHRWT
ncbi:uncharacterized protein JN550_000527 [Neoarthrinium moseri]|uniref:uncharacterized protein n=1 Tax=Neoarthrinium moseri TaxID=1658444 RepID=UPI001FDD5CA7|nr:uncharacterized protein JN550_000527 [Neoarthrinium moseri]KAI1878345.1 hypothetical protein JN550_000527 [Neoarthrinium moseri]